MYAKHSKPWILSGLYLDYLDPILTLSIEHGKKSYEKRLIRIRDPTVYKPFLMAIISAATASNRGVLAVLSTALVPGRH
eukprot:scaffold296835_cov14-Prasinocladus_malaysianus.AAC.1